MKLNTTKSHLLALAIMLALGGLSAGQAGAEDVALTRAAPDAITPTRALEMLKEGNERFVGGDLGRQRDRPFWRCRPQCSSGPWVSGGPPATGRVAETA